MERSERIALGGARFDGHGLALPRKSVDPHDAGERPGFSHDGLRMRSSLAENGNLPVANASIGIASERRVKRGDIGGERASPWRGVGARGAIDVSRQRCSEAAVRPVVERGRVGGVAAVEGAAHRLDPLRNRDIRQPHLAQGVVEMQENAVDELLGHGVGEAAQRLEPPQHEAGVQREQLESPSSLSGTSSV